MTRGREHLVERRPQPQRAVATGEQRRGHSPVAEVTQHAGPRRGALAVAKLHGQQLLAAVLAGTNHNQ